MIRDDPAKRRAMLAGLLAIGVLPFLLNGWINSYIYDKPVLYWGFEFCSWVLLPVLVFTVAARKAGLRRDELGLTTTIAGKRSGKRVLLTTVILCPLAYLWYLLARYFAYKYFPDPGYFNYVLQVLRQDEIPRSLVAAYFALSAGIVEELYYRGLLLCVCRDLARPRLQYLAIATLLFALMHWENGVDDMLYTGLFGLLFALLYLRWRNLWPLIGAHVYIDLLNFT